jgi:hypothetical protein
MYYGSVVDGQIYFSDKYFLFLKRCDVNFYNATSSLVRFENKNIFFVWKKTLQTTRTLAL